MFSNSGMTKIVLIYMEVHYEIPKLYRKVLNDLLGHNPYYIEIERKIACICLFMDLNEFVSQGLLSPNLAGIDFNGYYLVHKGIGDQRGSKANFLKFCFVSWQLHVLEKKCKDLYAIVLYKD